ncbi:hypothetical protein BRYFOR_06279 [Marvinbryantia formatexigens DSM 14469]|uniref:DUF3048 domain-containing protein n=1 Tax=Marvinbryantia formatexigens DSM 14469 TaxID=478749 RepID=C6LCD2_9FIRM|nr:DUF3048 domain-containing protein [Marvinbryantia formatexigens]EET61596.1 hypothetical protein BRYFOR_06279 [Marvinbryantia formatexigens DSM 14469]UWO24575.1 DUF3048 domain-containing protein [Marvinbryantia formatexigens DSM 14469]SDF13933.1 Protein of unknown function [Marvinbryantia formatexigens]
MKAKAFTAMTVLGILSLCLSGIGITAGAEDSYNPSWKETAPRSGALLETPDENGQVHSYLTGKLTDASIAQVRPMSIMINNISDAMPQAGISRADVVYEAPVEGDITRLLAFFEDYADLDKIGPVRSCRDYFIDFAMEFDAIYTHYGQAVYAFDLLNSSMVDNISGLQYQDSVGEILGYAGEDIFYRTDDRPAPHNAYTSYSGLMTAVERNGYSMQYADDYSGHFLFAADGERVSYSDGTATYIRPSLYSNSPYFEYDASSGQYLRYQYGGAQIDELTGSQLAYDNVIIQYCPVRAYDDNGYIDIDTHSGGSAILFTNGTFQNATWSKDGNYGVTRYYDASGNELKINQGKTWVCIVQDTRNGDTLIQ